MLTPSDTQPQDDLITITQQALNETCLLLESKNEQLFQLDTDNKRLESELAHMRVEMGSISRDLSTYVLEQFVAVEELTHFVERLDTLADTQEPVTQACKIPELDILGRSFNPSLRGGDIYC